MDEGGASCPSGTVACGNGCIPQSAVCCVPGSSTSSSYCTNAAGASATTPPGTARARSPADRRSSAARRTARSAATTARPASTTAACSACRPDQPCSPADVGDAGGGDDASAADSPGVSTATYVGATYQTALGDAKGMASGCVYSFSVSGSLTLDIVGDTALSGNVDGLDVLRGVDRDAVSRRCRLHAGPYTVTPSSNDISGSYAAVSATAADGAAFNVVTFAGKQVGNTLTGSLTINVTTYDLDGGGSYVTFPPVVISGYTLTKQ